jgi:hypothetical protein
MRAARADWLRGAGCTATCMPRAAPGATCVAGGCQWGHCHLVDGWLACPAACPACCPKSRAIGAAGWAPPAQTARGRGGCNWVRGTVPVVSESAASWMLPGAAAAGDAAPRAPRPLRVYKEPGIDRHASRFYRAPPLRVIAAQSCPCAVRLPGRSSAGGAAGERRGARRSVQQGRQGVRDQGRAAGAHAAAAGAGQYLDELGAEGRAAQLLGCAAACAAHRPGQQAEEVRGGTCGTCGTRRCPRRQGLRLRQQRRRGGGSGGLQQRRLRCSSRQRHGLGGRLVGELHGCRGCCCCCCCCRRGERGRGPACRRRRVLRRQGLPWRCCVGHGGLREVGRRGSHLRGRGEVARLRGGAHCGPRGVGCRGVACVGGAGLAGGRQAAHRLLHRGQHGRGERLHLAPQPHDLLQRGLLRRQRRPHRLHDLRRGGGGRGGRARSRGAAGRGRGSPGGEESSPRNRARTSGSDLWKSGA